MATSETLSSDAQDELLVLEAIYPDFVAARKECTLQLRIPVDLDHEHTLVDIVREQGQGPSPPLVNSVSIRHLPPVLLTLILTSTYPSVVPPEIQSIRSLHSWVPHHMLKRLKRDLQDIWHNGESILCSWVEFVRSGSFLDQVSTDRYLIRHPTPHLLSPILIAYNSQATRDDFQEQSFTCPICFSSVKGSRSIMLSCSHVTCHACLSDYWSLCIKEGDIDRVGCPFSECVRQSSEAKEDEVAHVVSVDLFQRWRWLRQKRITDRDPTAVYCPLDFCRALVLAPSTLDEEIGWSRLRTCPRCNFAFCSLCRRTWHGPHTDCATSVTTTLVLEYMALEANDSQRSILERRFGKSFLRKLVVKYEEDRANERWFEDSTTSCPGCSVKVQKALGCNHMTCVKCKQHFCYLCGTKLNAQNPYSHFSTPMIPCFNRLFEFGGVDNPPDALWIPM